MARIFGKSKELEGQLKAMRQEMSVTQERCRAKRDVLQKRMVQGLTNIHLYGQLTLEETEESAVKEKLRVMLSECERLLGLLTEN